MSSPWFLATPLPRFLLYPHCVVHVGPSVTCSSSLSVGSLFSLYSPSSCLQPPFCCYPCSPFCSLFLSSSPPYLESSPRHSWCFTRPATYGDKYSRMVVFAFFEVIFGGRHCLGWNFTYPTPFERHLWLASAVAITAIPFMVAPIDYILENFELKRRFGKKIRLILDLFMTILLFIYIPARLSLIGQALALLRNQPPTYRLPCGRLDPVHFPVPSLARLM